MLIVSREAWGARPPASIPMRVEWPRGVTLHLHHTAGPPSQTPRQIQEFHQRSRGWSDVGYNYLIAEDGTVYEGRGRNVRGAHSPPVNHEPGVALIGTYEEKPPTDAQHRAVYELMDHLGAGRIKGHRDSSPTTCPGSAAYSKVIVGGRPKPLPPKKPTLYERLRAAGFGARSARKIIAALGGKK